MHISIPEGKRVYFASDSHLGAPNYSESRKKEAKLISWLDLVSKDAQVIFLLGDIFDFWFEYKTVVPKGFVRLLGKLAALSDAGISIYIFVGNHDLWMKDYFETELGIPVFHKPLEVKLGEEDFLIGHGDGLGPGDTGFKLMKKVFTNPVCKWFFRWVHPDIGVALAQHLSQKNKMISGDDAITFLGEDKEWLVQYCKRKLTQKHRSHFVFGHRHLPMQVSLNQESIYTNIGDWCTHFTYGAFDGHQMQPKTFTS